MHSEMGPCDRTQEGRLIPLKPVSGGKGTDRESPKILFYTQKRNINVQCTSHPVSGQSYKMGKIQAQLLIY